MGLVSLSFSSNEIDRSDLALGDKCALVVWPAPKMQLDSKRIGEEKDQNSMPNLGSQQEPREGCGQRPENT